MRGDDLSAVAGVAQRLAVLLGAGVAPASAWGFARASAPPVDDPADLPSAIAAAGAAGGLEGQAWRGLAAAWTVASAAGAPLAPTLRAYATALRSLAQVQRDVAVALAGPVTTARLVMALPFVGMLFGAALGFDTLGTLFGTPIGWGCLLVGGGLIAGAALWNRSLVRAARPRSASPGLGCDLVAIAMAGGGSMDRARAIVEEAATRYGLDADDRVTEVLDLARRAGVPAAELLRSEADDLRAVARTDAQRRAASLAARLMLPLGLCVLPAFMVLGVVPMLVAVLNATVLG